MIRLIGDEVRNGVPELQAGDRLTAIEFERRYQAMPQIHKAELIEGVVYMPSPVKTEIHGGPHFDFITWLGYYRTFTRGVQGGDNSTLRLDMENVPQPDAFLRILPEFGGQSLTVDGYVERATELIGEISASTVSYDLHDKLNAYRRNGVQEYVVWRVLERAIDWFILRNGRYDPLPLTSEGPYKSQIFPGLWLDPAALISGDMERVHQIVQQGLASPEYEVFKESLLSKAPKA